MLTMAVACMYTSMHCLEFEIKADAEVDPKRPGAPRLRPRAP